MVRFTLFGIPVVIQPWFWITIGLIGVISSDPSSAEGMIKLVMFVTAAFLSVMVHELGHALTGKFFGAPTQITLQAFGGFAAFPANFFTRTQSFLVTAAGPVVQILFGLVFVVIDIFVTFPTPAANILINWLWVVSFFWALLNLIPVIPFDGGQLMATLLGPNRRSLALKVSFGVAIVGGLAGFLLLRSLFFPIFLGMMARQNWQELQYYKQR